MSDHIFRQQRGREDCWHGIEDCAEVPPPLEPKIHAGGSEQIEVTQYPGRISRTHRWRAKVRCLPCTVHVVRIWTTKIYHAEPREQMVLTMYQRTETGCDYIIQQAVKACPCPDVKQRISRKYQSNTICWTSGRVNILPFFYIQVKTIVDVAVVRADCAYRKVVELDIMKLTLRSRPSISSQETFRCRRRR